MSLQQAADALAIPTKTLTAWESGRELPEIRQLTRIADLYDVTIDDLFARKPLGFDNYAQQLAAAFDNSRDAGDFALAEGAFRHLDSQTPLSTQDLLLYAGLQQAMAEHCLEQALSLYTRLAEKDPDCRAGRRQHMHLLIRMGRESAELTAYLTELSDTCTDPEEWLAVICAFQDAGRSREALHWLRLARNRFPGNAMLCYWGGTICQCLEQWEDALGFWEQALSLDPDFTDASYACAECKARMGDPKGAWAIWHELALRLERRGLITESAYPKEQARQFRGLIGGAGA